MNAIMFTYYYTEECRLKDYLEKIIKFWKAKWGTLIVFTICGSIVALFIASFCLEKELTLSVMNEWVSLVVGMVALILGIISLFLSFYNVEQSNATQKETIEIMNNVKKEISDELDDLKDKMNSGFADMREGLYFNRVNGVDIMENTINRAWRKK